MSKNQKTGNHFCTDLLVIGHMKIYQRVINDKQALKTIA